mmetsp:Transcript_5191/g.12390  ORF Transcript_5191/g.12390 Transcript_5191/m.12390 type:complete len:552 (+) Transcript_5191:120-1775(+)
MKFSSILSTLCLLATSFSALAEDTGLEYEALLETPVKIWSAQLFPEPELGPVEIEAGNGVFMAPDGKHALVTTIGASVYAFNAYSGEVAWVYQPEASTDNIARCHSGVTFGPDSEYMVYAVVDNENSLSPTSRVIAVDMTGAEVWVSDDLEGVAAGNPQVSSDGSYVFLTHNANELTNGYFTVLDGETGSIFYGGSSGEAGDIPTKRYGPVGIFHTPVQGNYDPITSGAPVSEGDFNTNDMLMWSQTPKPTDTSIENGFLYGFQFPRDFAGNASEITYFQMGSFERDFQAVTPPVMTNGGLSAYWGVSRGGFRGWIPKRFSRARDVSIGFSRNSDFAGQPVWAQPALSNDGPEPTIFGGSAAREFVKLSFDFQDQTSVTTGSYVKSAAIVDGGERAVYYVEEDGTLHMTDFDLEDLWTESMGFTVTGEMALTPRSDVLVVGTGRGVVTAYQVAEIPVTDSPSDMPSDGPSMSPTESPTDTKAPVVIVPTEAPVVAPTDAPVAVPMDMPVDSVEPVGKDPLPVSEDTPSGSASSTRSLFVASAAFILATMML